MPGCLLYLADSAQGEFSYELPYGRAEQQTGSAYAPESFAGNSHTVTVRPLNEQEKTGYRNLALNPCDVLKPEEGPGKDLDKIRLMVRADFPHDSYWKSAVVEFSDGSLVPIQITSSAEFQEFSFPKRRVSWFRIHDLVPEDPARWCAFIEVEAWGHDLP